MERSNGMQRVARAARFFWGWMLLVCACPAVAAGNSPGSGTDRVPDGLPAWVRREMVRLAEAAAEGGSDAGSGAAEMRDPEFWERHFRYWLERGLDPGTDRREELEGSCLLTAFQVESILDYRRDYGGLSSAAELAFVDGFTPARVAELAPFLRFGGTVCSPQPVLRQELRVRVRSRLDREPEYGPEDGRVDEADFLRAPGKYWLGPPVGVYARYRLEYGQRLGVGLTLEQDPGEPWSLARNPLVQSAVSHGRFEMPPAQRPGRTGFRGFPDFVSGYVSFGDLDWDRSGRWGLERAVIGDFTLRFGQGLTVWKSFALSGVSDPGLLVRRGDPLMPYGSSDESRFFRGAAAVIRTPAGRWTLACSGNRTDARTDSAAYYSLPADGYHRTLYDWRDRHTLQETVLAVSGVFSGETWRAGVQGLACRFDKHNARDVTDWNAAGMYDGWWSVVGVDGYAVWRGMRFFGEAVLDRRGTLAALAGWAWSPVYALEAGLLLRRYPEGFVSPHAGAYATGSSCANESGVTASLRWRFGTGGSCLAAVDWCAHPGPRYRVPGPSSRWAVQVQPSWNGEQVVWEARLRYRGTSVSGGHGFGVRLQAGAGEEMLWNWQAVLNVQGSCSASEPFRAGRAGMLLGGYRGFSGRLDASVSLTVFHADRWDDRVYLYQRDVPGVFSFPSFSGRGASARVYVQWKTRAGLTCSGSLSWTGYAEGKPAKAEVKGQAVYRF